MTYRIQVYVFSRGSDILMVMKFLILPVFLGFYSSAIFALHIIVDPGHGGRDRGAAKAGVYESKIALNVGKILAQSLRQDPRFQVTLTRDEDKFISLEKRAEIAKAAGGDLFISIHVNSSPDSRARGAEFYFQNQLAPDEESLFLASRENEQDSSTSGRREVTPDLPVQALKPEVKTILFDLLRNHRIMDSSLLTKTLRESWQGEQRARRHSIRQAPFYVVSSVHIPSVLIELGFITHSSERQKLTRTAYQEVLAGSIYEGLVNYKELMDKQTKTPLNNVHAKQSKTLE